MQLQPKQKINICKPNLTLDKVNFSKVFNIKLGSVRFCYVSFLSLNKQKQQLLDGRTVENKSKLILIEIFPLVQKHDI